MGEVHYELAIRRWRRGGNIEILSIHDTQIAVFPLEFVAKGEDNTWQFVLDVVQQLVEPLPDHPATIFTDDGEPVNLVESPSAGIFRYKQLSALLGLVVSRFTLTRPYRCPVRSLLYAWPRVFQPFQAANAYDRSKYKVRLESGVRPTRAGTGQSQAL
jgi:hypothetical protein